MTQTSVPVFHQAPGVLMPTATYFSMQRGSRYIVDAIRPTLGPYPRKVAIERTLRDKAPEFLDNGALIARRIIDLPDPDENIGAMFLRGLLWRLYEQVGDGTATAAVLFQSVFDQGLKFILAGGNPMRLRGCLEQGMHWILEELSTMIQPARGRKILERVARGVCAEPRLAATLAEVMDVIGEYGALTLLAGHGRELRKEYIDGSYWSGGLQSRTMIENPALLRTQMPDAGIVISDLEIDDPQALCPVLEAALKARLKELVIIAARFSERALGYLTGNRKLTGLHVVAVKTPGLNIEDQRLSMEDLAVLTGGRRWIRAAGDSFHSIKPQEFGRARRVWADQEYLGIIGGQGRQEELRRHIQSLKQAMQAAETTQARNRLRDRVGRLSGAMATLWIGGATESEIETQRELARRTSDALRGAIGEGVVRGGGLSLLACSESLKSKLKQAQGEEQAAALKILIKALQEPFQIIMTHAGYEPGMVRSWLNRGGGEHGFDLVRDLTVSGNASASLGGRAPVATVLDVATVLKSAVRCAISGAALALTVDVFVHRKTLPVATRPD